MKKLLLTFMCLLGIFASAAADDSNYTISFKSEDSDSNSSFSSSDDFKNQISDGKDYVNTITDIAYVYPGANGIKLSSSKNNGKFTINLSEAGKVKITSLIVNAAYYSKDTQASFKITINNKDYTVNPTKSELDNYNVDITGNTAVIDKIAISATKRVYIKSITVNYSNNNSDNSGDNSNTGQTDDENNNDESDDEENALSCTIVSSSSSSFYSNGYITGELNGEGESASWDAPGFVMKQTKNSSSNKVNLGYDEIRIYQYHSLGFTPKTGYKIIKVEIESAANKSSTPSALGGTSKTNCETSINENNITITPTDKTKEFSLTNSGQVRCNTITVTYKRLPQTITLAADGISSFSSTDALDFTNVDGVKAYVASNVGEGTVVLTRVYEVPSNTGLVLIGEANGKVNVPVLDENPTLATNNMLVAVAKDAEIPCSSTTTDIYVLGTHGDEKAFHRLTNNPMTSKGNFAYLAVPKGTQQNAPARRNIVFDDEDATGIEGVSVDQNTMVDDNVMYNISGQRVDENYKGIVIINGKKYLNK